MKTVATLILLTLLSVQTWGHPSYVGYSGAPGCRGRCSQSCHATRDFAPSVSVTGFPATYIPGQQYTIAVGHQSGASIANFNCSIRIGTGPSNAGTLAAGTNTAAYTHTLETNGIHFSGNNLNSGDFVWTAPAAGTGDVRLYLVGLQGTLSNGADTAIIIASSEGTTNVGDQTQRPDQITLSQNYPNPFNSETIVEFSLLQSQQVDFEIANILGQVVYKWSDYIDHPGKIALHWNGKDSYGVDAPSGVYFYRLHTSDMDLARKMVLLR